MARKKIPAENLTKAERNEVRKALVFLSLGPIADDLLDFVDERRKAARFKATFDDLPSSQE